MKKKTNTERYRVAFDSLHLSEDFEARLAESLTNKKENEDMNIRNFFNAGRAAAAAAVVLLTCGTVCYAADAGGLRTTISMWLNGRNESLEVTDRGDGVYSWTDAQGTTHNLGGYVIEDGGEVTAMSAEEMAASMSNGGSLEFTSERRVIFHYHNLNEDVTDSADSDGNIYIHVNDPSNPNTYFTFTDIGADGTYQMTQDETGDPSATYLEADVTGLISEGPVQSSDISTTVEVTRTGH